MNPQLLFGRYCELQRYVGWTDQNAGRIHSLTALVEPSFAELVDDFYREIQQHPKALKVITGGQAQIERLKGTLIQWLRELFAGPYDADYVARRWRVGYRHVEIGLDQVYTNVALSRLRRGIHRVVEQAWAGEKAELLKARDALNMLLDLDLAIIEDAYQTEYLDRQQQAERLAAIGQVAGGIAHELRNPLNVIKTSVYYLLNARSPSPEKTAEHLGRIEKQVELSDSVITTLSNFAKLPIPILQPFGVEAFLGEAVQGVGVPAEIETRIECPPSIPKALGDVNQLHIVLRNLIRNACDAMPEGGRLTIRAEESEDQITIAVSDTGHGIESENLHRIMQPLFSTKARGIGLGLAMARAIVEKNEGALTVASIVGKGATFTVRLRAESGPGKIEPETCRDENL
jgi:signal transduction histidine kinase